MSLSVEEIEDADVLWRRVPRIWFVHDEQAGHRISRAAFSDSSDGSAMSVDVARMRETAEQTREGYPNCGVVGFPAKVARDLNLTVEHTPVESNPAHSSVIGKKTKGVKGSLRDGCEIELVPPYKPPP